MTVGGVRQIVASLCVMVLATVSMAAEPVPVEVRVRSIALTSTIVTIRVTPGAVVEDRTPGAQPAHGSRGPASLGQTFSDEIELWFPGLALGREAVIEVGDEFVSEARLGPEDGGATLRVFVRRPVSYTITRPSALGEVTLAITPRKRPDPRADGAKGAPDTTDAQVAVDAESLDYDQEGDVLVARGNVTLSRGAVTLRADELRYDRKQQIADAKGHVVLSDADATVTGDVAHFRLDDETGWIDHASSKFTRTQYRLNAGRVEKQCGPVYDVEGGRFTTCECGGLEKPSWSLGGSRTHVALDGFGIIRGAVMRVKDTPVLWVPFLAFPANSSRASGFLMPRVGISKRRGFQYEQPFFWAIDKSSDATIAVDVETEARIGAIAEYRYVASKTTRGSFTGAYFNESIRGANDGVNVGDPTTTPTNRFAITGRHTQKLLGGSAYVDAFVVSDELFLREINNFADTASSSLNLRSTRYTKSDVGWLSPWQDGFAHVESRYYQDLIDPQKFVLQRVPQMRAQHELALLGGRAIARLPGQFAYFYREHGFTGARADVAPQMFVPFNVGTVLAGSVTGMFHETAYQLGDTERLANKVFTDRSLQFYENAGVAPPTLARLRTSERLRDLDAGRTRETGEVRARVGTEVAKVFEFGHLGFEKLRHSLEPELQYLWVPDTAVGGQTLGVPCQAGESPGKNCGFRLFNRGILFDEVDAVRHRNFASWGLTSRILARAPTRDERIARQRIGEDSDDGGDEVEEPPIQADALPAGFSAAGLPLPEGSSDARNGQPLSRGDPSGAAARPSPRVEDDDDLMPESHELARASVVHGYDFSRAIDGPSHASAVDVALRVTPTTYAGLSYRGTMSIQQREFLTQSVGGFIREPWWRAPVQSLQRPSSVGVSYRVTLSAEDRGVDPATPEGKQFANSAVEEIDWSAYLRLGNYAGLTFSSRYNLLEQEFFEQNYGVRLMSRCNCWALDIGYTDRIDINDTGVRVQLTLVGLGSFGSGNANGNYAGLTPTNSIGYRRPTALGGGY